MRNNDHTWKRETLYHVIKRNKLDKLFKYESEYEEKIFEITPNVLSATFVDRADYYDYWLKDRVDIYDVKLLANQVGSLGDGGGENDNPDWMRTSFIPFTNPVRVEVKGVASTPPSRIIGYIHFYDENHTRVDRFRLTSSHFNRVLSFTANATTKYFRVTIEVNNDLLEYESIILACSPDFTPGQETTTFTLNGPVAETKPVTEVKTKSTK